MSVGKFLQQAAAGNAGGAGATYVDDVFSCFVYQGNNSTNQIVNGIDLAGEGGLVWQKARSTYAADHLLTDSVRGRTKILKSNSLAAEVTANDTHIASFNSDGFTLGTGYAAYSNFSGITDGIMSWTFRKHPGFFDIVTYTGTGSTQTISHNLGATVGTLIIKRTSGNGNWSTFARTGGNAGSTLYAYFNSSAALNSNAAAVASGVGAEGLGYITTTGFKPHELSGSGAVGNVDNINDSGATYVAYLFAHDAQDFGTDSDKSIIKCGSWTSAGNAGPVEVNLGWEPQFILWKRSDASVDWIISDNIRGMTADGSAAQLYPNRDQVEGTSSIGVAPTATGFKGYYGVGSNIVGANLIYIAIRKPHKPAEEFAATDLFKVAPRSNTASADYAFVSNFPVDMGMARNVLASTEMQLGSRMTGDKYLQTPLTNAEATVNSWGGWDSMNSVSLGFSKSAESPVQKYAWMFRRAPGFFDVVAYTGNGVNGRAIPHNLGVIPEMIVAKNRNTNENWPVYHSSNTSKYWFLNSNSAGGANNRWGTHTETDFLVGNHGDINGNSSNKYIAYLFATVSGISKVGSYSGTGATQTINCGFSSGARFVLIKRTDSTGSWSLFDSERGIVVGNDPVLYLQVTSAQTTTVDWLEPDSSGFKIVTSQNNVNASGGTYLFLAIA